ncbi:MAG: hypothetical protein ISP90_18390 [Nevskia sp.]|nr:hypothetical protein [Nevskia sp.]
MTDETAQLGPLGKVWQQIEKQTKTHPLMWLVTLFSVGLAIWSYLYPRRETPDVMYYVDPDKTELVKQGTLSDLSVSFKGAPITGDVTAVQMAIWNAGMRAVHASEIMDTVFIQANVPVQILQAKTTVVTRKEIGFEIEPSRANSGALSLNWKILEKGDGAIIQIVYAGGPGVRFSLNGSFEGQRQIREIVDPKIDYLEHWWLRNALWLICPAGIALAAAAAFLLNRWKNPLTFMLIVAAEGCIAAIAIRIFFHFRYPLLFQ